MNKLAQFAWDPSDQLECDQLKRALDTPNQRSITPHCSPNIAFSQGYRQYFPSELTVLGLQIATNSLQNKT